MINSGLDTDVVSSPRLAPRCWGREILPATAVAPPIERWPPRVDCAAFVLVNVLNPKLSIFFLAFLPQFVPPDEPWALSRMVGLSAVFMLLTFIIFVGYGLVAAAMRGQVIGRPRVVTWLRRTFAAAFIALGARLALADR